MGLSYTYLTNYFTLKTYSPIPTTWSSFMTQQPLIVLLNMLQPHWRDEGLQPKIQCLNPLNERSRMAWLVRVSPQWNPLYKH